MTNCDWNERCVFGILWLSKTRLLRFCPLLHVALNNLVCPFPSFPVCLYCPQTVLTCLDTGVKFRTTLSWREEGGEGLIVPWSSECPTSCWKRLRTLGLVRESPIYDLQLGTNPP